MTAVAALKRRREMHPERFNVEHLRMVQRFMKVRRLTMAQKILVGASLPSGLWRPVTSSLIRACWPKAT